MAPRKKYYVGKSKIHGEGSFAKKDLSAGEYIGKAHTVKKLYSDYDFTELGMKHNHSENPSTLDVEIGNERHLIAKRPIKKGEELTTNYRVLQDLKQPEDFENGGWLDKYDAPQAQNGIEGTMGGLTDKGFNYNGAWGGPSMQMGGNIMPAMAGANQTVPMARDGRRQPIYTSDPKDPRLRNYKDSLSLYNQTKWLQDLKFDGSRTIGSGQPIYGRLATNRNVINNPDAEWNYYNNINRNIRPVAYLDEYYVNSPNDRQPTTLSGRVALYKKPVQPVTYKKSQPKPPRKLEKPGKVDLPEQIQFKDLPQPRGDYKIAAPELQMISDKPTKYSFTYGEGRNQKSIYFPNKTIWQAFVDQYDGLNTTERAGSFEAIPGTYSTYRRPNPAFKDVKFAMGGSLPGSVGFTYARTAGAAPANGPYAKKTKASARDGKNLSYSQWKKQYNLKETPDYNLKRAWELGYTPDKTGHLPTVDNQTGQFLKAKGHPTLQLELDWYNSPEGAEFRSKNAIDSSGKFFKYVPKGQNGQEMKYYQAGLDFKPKTISKNGGWLDKYNAPQARDGNDILEYLKKDKTAPVVTKGKPLTADQQKRITAETLKRQTQKNKPLTATNTREQAVERGRAENLRVIEENKEAEEQAMAEGKAAEATRENPNVPFTFPTGETKLWKDMDWRERQYVSGRNLGSMSRFNNWTDWINPITMIGEMGEGLATAPYMARVTESNLPYVAGIASPLLGGALGGLGTRSTGQFANNMLNPVAGMDLSFNKIGEKITNTMLSPFPKSTQSAIRSFNIGLNRGIGEVLSGRPISETFPITKKQIELAKQKATQEHAQGSRFARDWYYDTKGAIRPEVEQKIENILKSKGAPFENVGYYPNYKTFGTSSYAHAGPMGQAYTFISNPLAETPDVLVGSSTKSISESNIPDYVKTYLLEKRHEIGGVNYGNAQFPGPSITLFGHGPNYYRPSIVGDIAVHEAGHTAQNLGGMGYDPITGYPSHMYNTWGDVTTTTDPDYKYYVPNLNTELGQRFGKAMVEPVKGESTWLASPNELHSDLMMARLRTHKNLMNQGLDYQTAINKLQKETMTDDAMVDEIIRQGSLNRFFKKDTPIEEKRALIRLLPAAVPAVGAASMLGGESEQPPKQQYGGDIPVDPMGYWNPENVGGPVIIPSNVISMEGVDQPLLGISDTGDVQYMMPGEDYEFDGEYVTEYPVAKKGISVNNADAQPLKKLDQLLNFTNYNKPTKGGWLDKYN